MDASQAQSPEENHTIAAEQEYGDQRLNGSDTQLWTEDEASSILWMSVGSAFLILALFGHVLSIAAVVASRRLQSLPVSVHLAANALSGILVACTGLLQNVIYHGTDKEVEIRNAPHSSEAGCQAHVYLTYFSLQLHAWIQATVSVERLIAVRAPIRYQRLCTRPRAVALVLLLAAILLLIDVLVPAIHSHDAEGYCHAHGHESLHRQVWGYMDMLLYSLAPAAIILPCNIFTVLALPDRRRQTCSTAAGTARSRPITIMLLSVNTVFLITTVPVSIIVLVDWPPDSQSKNYARFYLAWTIFSLLQYGGCSASFLIYCLTSSTFRRSLATITGRHSLESQAASIASKSKAPSKSHQLPSTSTKESGSFNDKSPVADAASELVFNDRPVTKQQSL